MSCDNPIIKTPETDPEHETIGQHFHAWDGKAYYCDSWQENLGFWMTQVGDPTVRRNVSERAIGRTFHQAGSLSLLKR